MPVIINGSTGISGTDGSAGTPAVQGTDVNTGMFFPAADQIAFAEGGVEAMRLDASGNVGIGTNSPFPACKLTVAGNLSVAGNSIVGGNTNASTLNLTGGTTFSTDGAAIALRGSNAGFNNHGMEFYAGGTERARITSTGELQLGPATAGLGIINQRRDVNGSVTGISLQNNDQRFTVENYWVSGVGQYTIMGATNATYTVYTEMYIRSAALYQQNGVGTFLFTTTGGNTSDRRIKEDLTPITGALAKVCALTGYSFKFSADYVAKTPDDTLKGAQIGVVAQEVEAVFPEIVHGTDEMKTVSYDKLVAPLIEAIKELKAENDALKARVAALEATP